MSELKRCAHGTCITCRLCERYACACTRTVEPKEGAQLDALVDVEDGEYHLYHGLWYVEDGEYPVPYRRGDW